MQVKVKKISVAAEPDAITPKWEEYIPGKDNGDVSLPVEYEIEGKEIAPLSVGDSYSVLRTKRNGVNVDGYFITSPVVHININGKHGMFTTKNSVYTIEFL